MNALDLAYLGAVTRLGDYRRSVSSYWRSTRATRARRYRHMLRLGVILAALFFLAPFAQMALAIEGEHYTGPLAAITAHDHLNNPVAAYELSIDEGQMHRAQEKIFPGMLLKWIWMYYLICIGNALMLVNIILEFKFITWLEGPALMIEQTLAAVIDQIGILGLLLTISAAIAGWHALRGRIGQAITQFIVACTIGALAGGLLSSPVGLLSGEDGLLRNASDFGNELTTELMGTDPESGEMVHSDGGLSNTVTTELVETFVRLPHQLVNYGANLDAEGDENCINTYNDMLGQSPWGRNPGFRDNIASACGEQYKDAAIEPANLIPTALIVAPGGGALTLAIVVVALAVFLACVWAFVEGALLGVHLLKGILPGEGRADMWRSIGVIATAVVVVAMALFCVALLVLVIRAVHEGMADENPYMIFIVVDLALLVGVVLLWRHLMGVKRKGKKLGDMLHGATGGKPSTAQANTRWAGGISRVASAGVHVSSALAMRAGSRGAPAASGVPARPRPAGPSGPPPSGPRGGGPGGPPPPPGGQGSRPTGGRGPSAPERRRTPRVVSGGMKLASFTPYGRAARVATVTHRACTSVRRADLMRKL